MCKKEEEREGKGKKEKEKESRELYTLHDQLKMDHMGWRCNSEVGYSYI
jgi:hypothetical protein